MTTADNAADPATGRIGRSHRDSVVAGVLTGAVVVVLGWGSGFGRLLLREVSVAAAPAPAAAPGTATTGATGTRVGPATSAGTSSSLSAPSASGIYARRSTTSTPASGTSGMTGMSAPTASSPSTGSASCVGLASAVADPFIMHVQHGHLSESPAQQAADLLDTSQYVQTHTVLFEDMTNPLWLLIPAVTQGVNAFVTHVHHGHLRESPSQQVADILDPDQYVQTHTVLIEDMTSPATDVVTGTC